jgi:acyl dehydratase
MSVQTHEFNTEALGTWGDPDEFTVERDRIKAYAAATNDPIEPHAAGDIAPPVFAVVPAFGAMAGVTANVIPPDLILMGVHGEQDFHFHRPIAPDTTLVTRATLVGVQPRSSGVTVSVKGETRDKATEDLVVEQYMTSFVRGAQIEGGAGAEAPAHGFDEALRGKEPEAEVDQTFDEDQTFRYSDASGDPVPIHLDDDVAKAMGLPGIIIHGLCTMAFTSVAVIQHACPEDPTRLERLAVRFSKVIQPKQTITTRIWEREDGALSYETTADNGEVVIKDGLAEVTR